MTSEENNATAVRFFDSAWNRDMLRLLQQLGIAPVPGGN